MANSRNHWGLYNVQMLAVGVNIEGTTLCGVVVDFHPAEPHRYVIHAPVEGGRGLRGARAMSRPLL